MFLSHYAEIIWTGSCRLTQIQRLNLNNGDNQRKACFVMFRVDLNILLSVTIVEVHTLNLDICVSLHDPIQIIYT